MSTTRNVSINSESELPDLDVPVHFQITDNKIEAVTVGGGDNQIRITFKDTYSQTLKVTKPQQAKEKTVFVVEGKLLGVSDFCSCEFSSEFDAKNYLLDLESKHGSDIGLKVIGKQALYFDDSIS